MHNTLTIALKEVRTYVASPVAYVIACVLLALTGYYFAAGVSAPFAEASIRGYLLPSTFIMVVIAPMLTMRLLAEEQKMGTVELLLTAPVRDHEVVLGKFAASFAIIVGTLALTLYYVILLYWFGDPDTGPVLSGYLGFLLYSAAAISIGIMASSLTSNQIVAAVLGFGILLILVSIDQISPLLTGIPAQVLLELSLSNHFQDFARGIIDTGDVIYYLSVTALFLFLAVRSLESRRWR